MANHVVRNHGTQNLLGSLEVIFVAIFAEDASNPRLKRGVKDLSNEEIRHLFRFWNGFIAIFMLIMSSLVDRT